MIYLRDVDESDMDLIFEWANDPLVRKNSFNSAIIQYDDHKKWFEQMMVDDSKHLFVLMDDNEPVGQIRLTFEKKNAEISYSICSQYRGKGYGRLILQLMETEVRYRFPEIENLCAKVKSDNVPSNKLFAEEGYTREYVCYSLKVNNHSTEESM